ncbi:MAG TPA: SDR family oxidoreductase [Polyangiaceae bacterium]|nr:SDR family oxidoreductase [Polyangiaceae bacterium]
MSDRVLVTGGFGYIGGRLCLELARSPSRRLAVTTRARRDGPPAGLPPVDVVRANPLSADDLARACEGADAVVHLAAANEIDSARDPEAALAFTTLSTLKLLAAARAAGARRFVYLSTAHVYGAPLRGRITEETPPKPSHPYAITHRAAEDFVRAEHDAGRLEGVVLRLSNAFGAPAHAGVDRWTLVTNDLARQLATTGRLALKTAGLQRRDFIPLGDAAAAVAHALALPRPALGDGVFNVGGAPMRVVDLAERFAAAAARVLGRPLALERPAPGPGDASDELDYRCDKLLATGFAPRGDVDGELEALARLALAEFGRA